MREGKKRMKDGWDSVLKYGGSNREGEMKPNKEKKGSKTDQEKKADQQKCPSHVALFEKCWIYFLKQMLKVTFQLKYN